MENRELHPNLQAALQLVEGIFQMLGSRYEVILHDLSHVESSIVALAGDVTHRKIRWTGHKLSFAAAAEIWRQCTEQH